jgi:hypothetical protein
MALRKSNPFDAPIPGQSLTDTPKNYPWENPPKYAKVEDAGLHILKKLTTNKGVMERVAFLLKTGISVESLTKTIIFSGFVEGAFTPDVGLLLTSRVSKMIFAIGKGAGIEKININPPKKNKTKELINTVLQSKLDDFKLKKKDVEDIEEMEEETKGLMSKGEEEDGSA